MTTEIPASLLGDIGATALLTLVVLLVLGGKLVPGRERDYWRSAFFEAQQQNRELMETGRVARDVLRALPDGESLATRGKS